MSAHTRGPWRAEVVPFGTGKRVEVTATGSTGGRGVVVRLVSHVSGPYGEHSLARRQADARLISASPDFFEAAERLIASHDGRVFPQQCACGECAPFRTAIAKAEGPP